MEELYKQMYLKYAPNLSEDEINNKVAYAVTQDSDSFVNSFYQKYTGSGPSENTQNYISTTARAMNPNVQVTDTPVRDMLELGLATMTGGGIKALERGGAGIKDLLDQAENWWDGEGWEKLTVQEKMANRLEAEKTGFNLGFGRLKTSDEINARIQKLQERQEYFNTSVTDDLFKNGDYGQGLERLALMGLGSWTSYLSMLNPYAIGVLAVTHAGEKWDEEWEKNPDEAGGLLALNAAGTGVIEFGGDMLARRFLLAPAAGNFRKAIGMGDGKAVDAVREATMNGAARFLKSAGLAMGGEGLMEMSQALAVDAWDSLDRIGGFRVGLGHNEEFDKAWKDWDRKKWHQIFDEGLVGAFMGGNVNVGLQGVNALSGNTAQRRAEVLLRTKDDQQYISDRYKELTKLEHEIANTNDESLIAKIREKQKVLSNELVNKQTQSAKIIRSLRGESLYNYASNVDRINRNKDQLEKKDIGNETRSMLEEENRIAYEENGLIWKDHVQQSLNRNLDISEAYAKGAGLEQIVIENPEEFQKTYQNTKAGKRQAKSDNGRFDDVRLVDGFFDGSGKWYINKSRALEVEAISVGSHELLHGVMKSTLRDSKGEMTKEGVDLMQSFVNSLSRSEYRVVQRRIDANYRFQRNNKGEIVRDAEGNMVENEFKDYAEEYLNAFSDAIQKNQIRYNESLFTKIMDILHALFRSKGINKTFKDGIDVYNFLKTYDRSIQTGKVDENILGMLKEGAKRPSVVQKSRTGDLMTDINDLVEPNITKEAFQRDGHFDATEMILDPDSMLNGMIAEGISESRFKDSKGKGPSKADFINEVKTRLAVKMWREYDPTKNTLFGWLVGKKSMLNFVKGDVANEFDAKREKDKPLGKAQSLDTTIEGKEGSQMAKQIADTAMNPEEAMIAKQEALAKQQADNLRNKLKVQEGDVIYDEVIEANKSALTRIQKQANLDNELNWDNLRDTIAGYFVSKITDKLTTLMGKGKKYIQLDENGKLVGGFLFDHGRDLIAAIPIRYLVQMERLIPESERVFTKVVKRDLNPSEIRAHEKKYGHTEALYYESETQGPTLYRKLVPSNADLLKFFNPPSVNPITGKRSNVKGERKRVLAERGAVELGFDATITVLKSMPKDSNTLIRDNKLWLQEEIEEVGKRISRDPSIQFSTTSLTALRDDVVANGFSSIFNNKFELRNAKLRIKYGNVVGEFLDSAIEKLEQLIPAKTRMAVEKLFKGGMKRGKGTEWEYVRTVRGHNIDGLEIGIEQPTEEGGSPDIVAKIHGKNANVEIKLDENAQFSSINISSYNHETGEITYVKKLPKKFVDILNKQQDKAKEALRRYYDRANELLKEYNAENNTFIPPIINDKSFIPQPIWDQLGSKGENLAIQIMNESKMETNQEIIKWIYNNKPGEGNQVYLLEILEKGLFSLGSKLTGIPPLKARVSLNFRIRSSGAVGYDLRTGKTVSKKKIDGVNVIKGRKPTMSVIPNIIEITSKSDITMLNEKHVRKLAKDNKPSRSEKLALENNNRITKTKSKTLDESISKIKTMDKALKMAKRKDAPIKGASFIDFDDTIAKTTEEVLVKMPDGTLRRLSPAKFAEQAVELEEMGATFDFSQFEDVKGAKKGPFFNKVKALKEKFGTSDIYILTARPAEAAPAIRKFLKSVGLNIPLKNIIGLADGRPEAKAEVIVEKAAEGYNDFLFADDQIKNVKAVKEVLDILDVKGKTYQAKAQFSKTLNENFNVVLAESQGVDPNEEVSTAAARVQGAANNKWTFFIPPSAEDFVGLLYQFVGKGKQGEIHMKFLEEALVKPFARAYRMLNHAKQAIANDLKGLKQKHKSAWALINKTTGYKNFSWGDAIRVYLWNRAGHNIPGMSEIDTNKLVELVENNWAENQGDLIALANDLELITRLDSYPPPTEYWTSGNIVGDLHYVSQNINRKQYLQEWINNKNEIFSPENMNKIEALYGSNFREALEDMLWRMETGTNRKFGKNRLVNQWLNWVNNSVGAIMFINIRSAMLQTISMVNFVNWTDNNPLKAGAAFANQPQFWKDFSMIFNSDTLKQRRAGLQTDVNEAELANAVARGQGSVNAAISYILKKGFTPTQMADSFAIAMGGASFYRNRMNTYLKQGMAEKEAHKIAFAEFLEISEKSQQSARPDMISQQQAGPLGRLILAFQNTPMQYMRLTKKAISDLKNNRGDVKTNISKIVYYTTIQNIIFSGLQSALFMAMGFSDDDEMIEEKKIRALNTSIDSILRGSGIAGASVATIKNIILQFRKQDEKGYRGDHARTLLEAANISPPIGSKLRKMYNSFISYKYNKEEIHQMGLHPDNPGVLGVANFISATTNIPLDRAVMIVNNARASSDSQNATWQRIATALGWNTWDVGIEKNLPKVKKSKTKSRKKKKRR